MIRTHKGNGSAGAGPSARSTLSRTQLVAAGRAELIERNGHLEVDSVASRAGLSVGLIYRHFDSRAGLLGAVVDDFYSRFREEALETNPVPGGHFVERERKRAELSVAFHYSDPLARIILSNLHLDSQVAVHEAAHIDEMIQLAANVVALGQRRGEVPKDRDPKFVAAMVIGGMRHVLAMALSENPPVPQQTSTQKLWAMIADIVGVPPQLDER